MFRGDRLRSLRNGLEISQTQLAERVNATQYKPDILQSRISVLENSTGKDLPSVQLLLALCEVLETNPGFLLGLTDEEGPYPDREDQVLKTVEDPKLRQMLQEICNLGVKMSHKDVDLIWQMTRRIAAPESGADKWVRLWKLIRTMGSRDLVSRLEEEMGTDATPFLQIRGDVGD